MRKILPAGVAISLVGGIVACNALLDNFPFTQGTGDGGAESGAPDATGDTASDAAPPADTGGPPLCTPGGACSTGCATGQNVCAEAGLICNATTPVQNGTPCGGSDHVCNGGACVACAAGSSCNDSSKPCLIKNNDCSTGAPVCMTTGNVAEGTPCGTGMYCYGGNCAQCTVGAPCAPPSNTCHVGVTSCANGTATCTDQGTNATTGTTCTTSGNLAGVCVSGVCQACTANAQCNPNGNVCQNGKMACSAGPVCTFTGNAPDGTSCGSSGQICIGGTCEVPCGPSNCPSGCCGAGNACVPYSSQTSTMCGTGGAACAGCTAPLVCGSAGACACPAGTVSCGAACVTLATDNNNCGSCGHACGPLSSCTGGYCPAVAVCTGGDANAANSEEIELLGTKAYIKNINAVQSCSLATTGASTTRFFYAPTSSIGDLVGDAQYLYWTAYYSQGGGTYSLDRSDGTTANTALVDTYPTGWNSAYVRTDDDPATGAVFASLQNTVLILQISQGGDGGVVPYQRCVSIAGTLTNAVAGGGSFFFADGTNNSVVGIAVSGGICSGPVTMASGLSAPGALATNGATIAFSDNNGVYACPSSSGGCVPKNAPPPLVPNQGTVRSLVLDAASPPNVYWIGSSGLVRCSSSPATCNGKPTVLDPTATPTVGMALDSTYVYYLQGNVLYRVAK